MAIIKRKLMAMPLAFFIIFAFVASLMIAAFAIVSTASTANATAQCPIGTEEHEEESHQEYKYSKVVPAQEEVSHQESRWYRPWEGPKEVEGWKYVNGSWVATPGWHTVPSHLNPPNNLVVGQTGSFCGNNKPYGLPNGPCINWRYQGGEEWWPSQTGWATSLDGAGDGAWGNPVATRTVVTQEASPAQTIYYVEGGSPSTDVNAASWVLADPDGDGPWTQFDERKVVDEEAWTETVYGPCPEYGVCETTIGPINITPVTAGGYGFGQTFQRDGGAMEWVEDGIVFTTPLSNDKITFGLTSADFIIPLYELTALSYTIDHLTDGNIASQRLSFNVPVDVNGAAAGGWTTVVVEPVYNGMSYDGFQGGDAIVWSSNPIPGFPNRDTFKSWNFLLDNNPDAVILGQILVNQGGGNAGLSDKIKSLTAGNLDECTTYTFGLPDNPGPKVEYSDWVDEDWQCQDTSTTQTRTKTTTTYKWDEQSQEYVVDQVSQVEETQVRDLTEQEIYPCPIKTPIIPDVSSPTCKADGSLTLVNGEFFTWNQLKFGAGTHAIVATTNDGWEFEPGEGVSLDGKTFTAQVTVKPKLSTGCGGADTDVFGDDPNAGSFWGGVVKNPLAWLGLLIALIAVATLWRRKKGYVA